jgi:hypothetical protein
VSVFDQVTCANQPVGSLAVDVVIDTQITMCDNGWRALRENENRKVEGSTPPLGTATATRAPNAEGS